METSRIWVYLFLHIWTAFQVSLQSTSNVTTDHFIKRSCFGGTECSVQLYSYKKTTRLNCALSCNRNKTCSGFEYDKYNFCTTLQGNCFQGTCSSANTGSLIYEKDHTCLHNGTWDDVNMVCTCTGGWVGKQCERLPYDCPDLVRHGYPPYTENFVLMDLYHNMSRVANVTCLCYQHQGSKCAAYIFNNFGSSSHNKTWEEYVNGYGNSAWDQWMGLENILAFNRMGYDVVEFGGKITNDTGDFCYFGCRLTNFTMHDSSSGYKYTAIDDHCKNGCADYWNETIFGGPIDIIAESQGVPFSTYDKDQDGDSINCASAQGAGWWFKTCPNGIAPINPMGANPYRTELPAKERMRIADFDFTRPEIANHVPVVYMVFWQNI